MAGANTPGPAITLRPMKNPGTSVRNTTHPAIGTTAMTMPSGVNGQPLLRDHGIAFETIPASRIKGSPAALAVIGSVH